MSFTVGTDSFVSLAYAEAYFENRLDVTAWSGASTTAREQALITATSILNLESWVGYVDGTTQALAFPRLGEYYDPIYGQYLDLVDVTVPDRVERATCETALHQLNNEGVLNDAGSSLDRIKVGSIELEGRIGDNATSSKPGSVRGMIKPLLLNSGSSSWWRAN